MFRDVQDFVLNFSSILWEALPFIVLGAIIAGILEELLPQTLIAPRTMNGMASQRIELKFSTKS